MYQPTLNKLIIIIIIGKLYKTQTRLSGKLVCSFSFESGQQQVTKGPKVPSPFLYRDKTFRNILAVPSSAVF